MKTPGNGVLEPVQNLFITPSMGVLMLVILLLPDGVARLPLAQRAFRSPAGARVTFLLLA
jgi:hypothetical protein